MGIFINIGEKKIRIDGKKWITVFLSVMAGGTIILLFTMAMMFCEIESKEYTQVEIWKQTYPEIAPEIVEFLKDNKINRYEYMHLQDEVMGKDFSETKRRLKG